MQTFDFREVAERKPRQAFVMAMLEGTHYHSIEPHHVVRAMADLMELTKHRYGHERRAKAARRALKGFGIVVEECKRPDGTDAVRLFSPRNQMEVYFSWF